MEQKQIIAAYAEAVRAIKEAILESRYRAARLVNKEVLALYYAIGGYISIQSRAARWGTNAIGTISELLQQELPGLRGFSETSIKRMRIFYESWCKVFENRPLAANDLQKSIIPVGDSGHIEIRPLIADEFPPETLEAFLSIGFSHHSEILASAKETEQRLFYIRQCAEGFWSKEKLKYYLKDDLYGKRGSLPNNFARTIANTDLRSRALRSFKDEYLLDFVNIEDPDETDERVIEQQIVHNIKNFIMALGSDFSFMGNQYRLVVSEKEYFIDLLFYNRRLQALIAIELKRGTFKPEYAGKLNFYLSALDEYVKLPYENPSIGIILCKDRDSKTVEFAFRDINKPMGVATYRTSSVVPKEYQGILPEPEELRKLM
jgi:predicted nuclease of restriction endonuclease-like (RecB) superfamily